MSTTLEEARKALILVQRSLDFPIASLANPARLSIIADYLDNQVPLAVENEQLRARLAHAESFMNTTNALPSQAPTFMEDRQKIGRALRAGVYGKFGPSRSDTLYREGNPILGAPDVVGFRNGQAYAKDVGKELRELTKEEKQRLLGGEFSNPNTELEHMQHAREIKEQFDACAAMQFNLCTEAINNPRSAGLGLLNTWGGAVPIEQAVINEATLKKREEIGAALSKLPPLHWCLKADCNCNSCVAERGYIV